MRDDNKMQIDSVYQELCERDPEWRHPKMQQKFQALYFGWRAAELRRKTHSHLFYTLSLQRGWLPIEDGRRFRKYALQ